MAQKVEVMLVCDLHEDETEEVEGVETVSFGLDGSAYEIDACKLHAAKFREAIATYVGAARRAGRASAAPAQRGARGAGRPAAAGAAGKERTQDIREWARGNGFNISERGRLPGVVVTAYDAAH